MRLSTPRPPVKIQEASENPTLLILGVQAAMNGMICPIPWARNTRAMMYRHIIFLLFYARWMHSETRLQAATGPASEAAQRHKPLHHAAGSVLQPGLAGLHHQALLARVSGA